ncbi:methionine-tRNA ligase [Candidatus Phycosocius bacilliformis]|uniref:Methionine--tRNA ligase n=1 Tax=Candidatus Phycosocius bacilliformis TaxID=1445552 RepID=A0A2P2ECM1_9PROT|nr:methionine--tRNA ligase [Candidatus Phycosocius bacilliformis]GBF58791.1 methionine-tRNA ligase [Candidatus Phycosocius bacilliformis]
MSRYLITSALPYINGIKHLGNLAGSMLPADVHARFRRLQGHEVLFICATDEHGTPAELAATEAGLSPKAYCDEQHDLQRRAGEGYGLSFDWFGRSSSAQNYALTQHFADMLEDHGLLEERVTKQVYCIDDGRFLPDRYVEGTCPICGFEDARGDQCDNCGSLLDPTQLKNPRSKISGSTRIEVRDTAHLFLRQPLMEEKIRAWVDAAQDWPHLARSIAYKWLDEGLQDRAITRDLSWGVPVTRHGKPRPGFENKVFYVWFDAPIEYIAATQEWADATGGDWQRWWRTDQGAEDVTYIQVMGKDNVAFHTVSFPVTILGSGEPWKLVDRLKAFNWLTWYGGKFSTSQKRGIFMDQALELLSGDYWRWYLMANAPESSDSAFTLESFQATINSDLANVLGNFVNRIMKFASAKFDGKVPDEGAPGELEAKLWADVSAKIAAITGFHEEMEFRKAAAETRALWAIGNEYLQTAAPWTAIKTDPARAAVGVRTGLNLVALFAILAQPFVPDAAGRILDGVGVPEANRQWPLADDARLLDALPKGLQTQVPDLLFAKIEDDQVANWAAQFGGGG